jgi:hypothetical protein
MSCATELEDWADLVSSRIVQNLNDLPPHIATVRTSRISDYVKAMFCAAVYQIGVLGWRKVPQQHVNAVGRLEEPNSPPFIRPNQGYHNDLGFFALKIVDLDQLVSYIRIRERTTVAILIE